MKTYKQIIFIGRLAAATLLLLGSASVSAAMATATAEIDWSTFRIIADPGVSLTFSHQSDNSRATLFKIGGGGFVSTEDTEPDWATGTFATRTNLTSTATARTSPDRLFAEASYNSGFFEPSASNSRSGGFTVSGNGFVRVQVDYSLTRSTTSSVVNAGLFFSGASPGNVFEFRALDEGSTDLSQSGTLGAGVFLRDGETGSLEASTRASVFRSVGPVPLPAGAWLFGSSLLGLIGWRRRRQTAA